MATSSEFKMFLGAGRAYRCHLFRAVRSIDGDGEGEVETVSYVLAHAVYVRNDVFLFVSSRLPTKGNAIGGSGSLTRDRRRNLRMTSMTSSTAASLSFFF
jgi:hypothetical protein